MEITMDKQRARQLYELADRLSKLDVNTLSEEQHQQRNTMIAKLQEEVKTIKEFAPDDGSGGEEDTLHKYARMWYNGNEATQQQVEKILDRMGWEIGELESEEGGAFVVQSGDENGNSYIGFAVADLSEGITDNKDSGEYDQEGDMARQDLATAADAASELRSILTSDENLPEWVQSKITKAVDYLDTVRDYMKSKDQDVTEASQRVDSLVTDALKIMRGSSMNDAVLALKTVLGDREYNGRRGHYNFYVRQIMDMSGQQGVAEAKRPSPKLTPVNIKKSDQVSEEINTEAYERLQKVFAFKNYES